MGAGRLENIVRPIKINIIIITLKIGYFKNEFREDFHL